MKTYQELIQGYKLVIWDKQSNIKCPTGAFTAEQIKQAWNIGQSAEVFYVVKGRNRTVASMYGTDLTTNYDTEDVVESGKLTIKDFVEQEYRSELINEEEFVECPLELLDTELLIVDERIK
jgi:hypothetical protein